MLNEEKVKSMTKAAAYENGPEKKNIEISNYFRTDYLGLQMVKSAIAYTAAFCLIVVIWAMTRLEELMLQLTHVEYLQNLLKILVILFVTGLIAYEIAVYAYYSWKYQQAKESVGEFQTHLKNIHKFYATQESAGEDIDETVLADEEITL